MLNDNSGLLDDQKKPVNLLDCGGVGSDSRNAAHGNIYELLNSLETIVKGVQERNALEDDIAKIKDKLKKKERTLRTQVKFIFGYFCIHLLCLAFFDRFDGLNLSVGVVDDLGVLWLLGSVFLYVLLMGFLDDNEIEELKEDEIEKEKLLEKLKKKEAKRRNDIATIKDNLKKKERRQGILIFFVVGYLIIQLLYLRISTVALQSELESWLEYFLAVETFCFPFLIAFYCIHQLDKEIKELKEDEIGKENLLE